MTYSRTNTSQSPGPISARSLRAVLLAMAVLLIPDRSPGDVFDEIQIETALLGEATAIMENGRRYTGEFTGIEEGRLRILVFEGAGQIQYSLRIEEIASVRLPGDEVERAAVELYDAAEYDRAIPLLNALFRQRVSYLEILDERQEETLVSLPVAYFETADYINAVSIARRLLRENGREAHRARLEALMLEGYFRLELYDQTAELAREWCSRQDTYPESAIGWALLAELKLREERYEEALWVALQPVAFSGARPMEYLDRAYAVAAHSYLALDAENDGYRLFQEMKEHGLTWPESGDRYAETRAHYREIAAAIEEEDKVPGDLEIDARPANKDLNLPLQHVRKLLLSLPE